MPNSLAPLTEAEANESNARNNTQPSAQFLHRFGTGRGEDGAVDIHGALGGHSVDSAEDDGSIPLANVTGLVAGHSGRVAVSALIGDGPHGSAGTGSGDYDYYAVPARAGQLITLDVQAAFRLGSTLDSFVGIYDSAGNLLAANDDEYANPFYGQSQDSFLRFLVPADDTYSVVVFGFGTGFQADPFDSASGPGAGSEGFYTLFITLDAPALVNSVEDDGAIPLANETGLTAGADGVAFATATIGDGPHGSAGTGTGDFDFYRLEAAAGQIITVDTDTPVPLAGVDTAVGIYDSAGNLLAANEDDLKTFDSYLSLVAPATGTYFVVVGYFLFQFPNDPFDPSSGNGADTEGDYSVTIGVSNREVDYYSFDLEAGDIVGAALTGGAYLPELFHPDGSLLVSSNWDAITFPNYPASSPLPVGHSTVAYVVNSPGRYAVAVSAGIADYTLKLQVFRPVLERQPAFSHQVLFLDFDGATVNPEDFPPFAIPPGTNLSPLSSFLDDFGLTASDESAVIDAIVATVAENYAQDVSGVVGRGRNGDFQITGRAGEFQIAILNSRDHADPFGLYPNVSRVIVGGTREEFGGHNFFGAAPAIDVGNFDTSETAVALLDLMSDPAYPLSLHRVPRANGATMIELIGEALGNLASHEAGHFFGNWHTDPFSVSRQNVMSPFDNFRTGILGPDGVFGTSDDVDMDFGPAMYSRFDPFDGIEDTLNTLAYGLSTGTAAGTYFDFVNGTLYVSGTIDDGRKDELKVRARGTNLEVFINGALADTRPLAGVRHIFFNGSGDRDTLDASGLTLPVTMMGRGGDDELAGGRANDILIGGLGRDDLEGGGGDDILIAGRTAFDVNTAALRAVLAEWTSPRDYATRVANLSGTSGGPRLNGEHFLKTTGSQATIFDDANEDQLTGGAGLDWFFASLSGRRRDEIDDLRSGEVLIGH